MFKRLISEHCAFSAYLFIAALFGLSLGSILCLIFLTPDKIKVIPEISFQIDPLNLLSVIVTIFLVVHVSRQLSKKDEGEKTERDLLIKHFTDFEDELTQAIRRITQNGLNSSKGAQLTYVNSLLKRYNMRLKSFLLLSTEQKFLQSDSAANKLLSNDLKNLKDLLTDTPRDGAIEDGIKVKNDLLFYSEKQVDKISDTISNMKCSIFKLIVEIHRANRN